MFNRINRKTFFILLLCIVGFTVVYLYYVKKQRQQNIAQYLPAPQAGDIYKIETENSVIYWQVKETAGEGVFFYRSKLSSSAASDIFLKQFDSSDVIRFSKTDLQDIKNGRWDDDAHARTSLMDITRPGTN